MTEPLVQQVLACPLESDNDSGATTVRGYLVALLAQLWREGQGFSGKRPFGTSAWQHDLLDPLIKQGLISGKFDEYGFVEEMDQEAGNRLIAMAIEALDID